MLSNREWRHTTWTFINHEGQTVVNEYLNSPGQYHRTDPGHVTRLAVPQPIGGTWKIRDNGYGTIHVFSDEGPSICISYFERTDGKRDMTPEQALWLALKIQHGLNEESKVSTGY